MKTRVLEILATLKRAGAERIAVSLARGLDRERFDTEVVSLYDAFPGGLEKELEEALVPNHHLGKRRGFDPRMYPRLWRIVRAFRPHVLHTHSYVMRYLVGVGRPAAMVHTVHNLADREVDGVGRLVHRVAYRHGALPVAVSAEVARSFRRIYGFDPAVIPNGIDVERFCRPEARGPWREANGFCMDDGLIVSVARLDPQKNPLGMLESFARALRRDVRWHLLFAGDGSLRAAVEERARAWEIAGRVHFLGVRADVPEMLSACDIFALASLWEGSPVSVMEAMAAGLPVAAAAVGGVPELVENGVTGLLARAGDCESLAAALAAMAHDAPRRREFAERSRRRAAGFGLDAMVESYSRIFGARQAAQ